MGTFKIEGGKSLKGEITPQGAKNEALQVLCPVLLTSEKVRVTNIPDIIDVNKLITLYILSETPLYPIKLFKQLSSFSFKKFLLLDSFVYFAIYCVLISIF